jgi:hypothetical protein
VERHHKSGLKEIYFPDGTTKKIDPHTGLTTSSFPDGITVLEHADGRKEVTDSKGTRMG